MQIPRVRPSSASKEGMRLSRGYSESSLRQSVVFHNEYKSMQEKLHKVCIIYRLQINPYSTSLDLT